VAPTVDAFRALARSSPWRWTTLHFHHRSPYPGPCEAWVRRPGELLVRTPDGSEQRVTEPPRSSSSRLRSFAVGSDDPDLVPPPPPPDPVRPHELTPVLRPDGLVAERPSSFQVDYDDPMHGNYSWVAMLDPVELSHHVEVASLREDEVFGRPAWRADLRAVVGYAPRCGGNCCELLYSYAGLLSDFDEDDLPARSRGREYPDHYDVALDVETGVVVRCRPVGGPPDAAWLENDILEVG
jgi:hypothetical protein